MTGFIILLVVMCAGPVSADQEPITRSSITNEDYSPESQQYVLSSVYYVPEESPQTGNRKPGGFSTLNRTLGASCVEYAKSKRPEFKGQVWGTPNKVKEVYDIAPFVGALVFTTESFPGTKTGHVAVVEEIRGDMIRVSEANYVRGKITSRWMSIDDPVIRGYR